MNLRQLSILTISFLFLACNNNQVEVNTEEPKIPVIPVEAGVVQRGDVAAYYTSTATLEAENEAQVVAKTSGIVKQMLVEEGDYVQAGQPVAILDDEQYRLELERAEASLRRLENEYNRSRDLYDRNMVSAEVFERSKFEYENQRANLNLARLNVEYSTIRATISGVVSERMVSVGNMLVNNQVVVRITDMDPLRAVIHLPEHELSKIKPGQAVQLSMDAIPNQAFTGNVARISPVVDRTTGTFRVVVYVSDKAGRLKPGMFARVRVMYDIREQTLVMPKLALISEAGNNSVFVIQDSVVTKRPVIVGYTNGSRVEILEGLDFGAQVVTVGQNSLRDSTRVQIVNIL